MDELRNLIVEDFGSKVLEFLPDPYEHGWNLPVTEDQLQDIGNKVIEARLYEVSELSLEIHKRKDDLSSSHNSYLAAKIPGHDLGNLLCVLSGSVQEFQSTKDSQLKLKNANRLVKRLTKYRSICMSMPYLASEGDERFLSTMPVQQLPYLLGDDRDAEIHMNNNYHHTISTAEYVSLVQLIKNGRPVKVTVGAIDVKSWLEVQDQRGGIVGRDGKPLQQLSDIFGDFTTKKEKGGTGLQVVKALMTLRKGYVEVLTKSEGHPAQVYDTYYNETNEWSDSNRTGSCLTLYTPTAAKPL